VRGGITSTAGSRRLIPRVTAPPRRGRDAPEETARRPCGLSGPAEGSLCIVAFAAGGRQAPCLFEYFARSPGLGPGDSECLGAVGQRSIGVGAWYGRTRGCGRTRHEWGNGSRPSSNAHGDGRWFGPMTTEGLSAVTLRSVVLDCPDPPALATFYADLLGGSAVIDPDWSEVQVGRLSPKLAFQRVEEYVPPEWPDGLPQQLHLDFTVFDLAITSKRAIELGACVLKEPVEEEGCTYQVHADPSGHPFCLVVERQLS